MLIERLKEWVVPTQETTFRINERTISRCKATDGCIVEDGRIKIPEVCWTKRETKRVENILDANEIREKFGLPTTLKIEIKRNYNRIKWGNENRCIRFKYL